MKAWWPLLLLALPMVAGAQTQNTDPPDAGSKGIYRTLDADGNVVFTDNPADEKDAEEVQVGPTNTMDSPPAGRRAVPGKNAPPAPPPPDTGYRSVAITAPDAGANLRIPQDNPIQVKVSLEPSLRDGHRLVILDNGTPLDGDSMDFPNPGEHTLVAQVRDKDGTVLIESRPLVFYVMRTTVGAGDDKKGGKGSAFPTYGGAAKRGDSADIGGRAGRGAGADRGTAASRGGRAERVTAPSGD